MYRELHDLLNIKIVLLHGNKFQQFINELLNLLYGSEYIPIRPQQDRGNDGCLKDKTKLFAVYAPETQKTFAEIKTKFVTDFEKYKRYWSSYRRFVFVFNNPEIAVTDITAQQLQLAHEYETDFWTRGYLLRRIEGELSFAEIRKLALEILQVNEEQYRFSIISWVVDDLTKQKNGNEQAISYTLPTGISEKIDKNFDPHDVETVKEEVRTFQQDFSNLQKILENPETAKILKDKVLSLYLEIGSDKSLSKKIAIVQKNLSKESQDDDYLYYVRCIIFYIFEQCLIGNK